MWYIYFIKFNIKSMLNIFKSYCLCYYIIINHSGKQHFSTIVYYKLEKSNFQESDSKIRHSKLK